MTSIRTELMESLILVLGGSCLLAADARPRVIATTDGEIDDRCSMVRFLLYANEWDIEGIIYSSSKFHWRGRKWEEVGWIERDIDLYAESYDTLKRHAPGFVRACSESGRRRRATRLSETLLTGCC